MDTRADERLASMFDGPGRVRLSSVVPGLAVFVVVFLVACELYRAALGAVPGLRLEETGTQRIKAQHLEEHLDEYTAVFLGSSRVFRQLNPSVFDKTVSTVFPPSNSYNLGIPGLRFYEVLYRVEEIVAREPESLRWLVIELSDPDPSIVEENLLTRREIEWHTPELSLLALRRALASQRTPLEKLTEIRGHLTEFAARQTNVATLLPALDQIVHGEATPDEPALGGFLPLDIDPNPSTLERRREFLEQMSLNRNLLQDRVDSVRAQPDSVAPDALLVETLRDLVARVRAAGVEPIFVIVPPVEDKRPEMVGAYEQGVLPNLYRYDDPDRYPEFYLELTERFDLNHLKRVGANKLTRLFAADFVERELGGEEE